MTLTYPTWWKGGRWDAERLLRDLFMFTDNGAAQGLSGLRVEPWLSALADSEQWMAAGNAFLLVHRMSGHVSRHKQQWVDVSIMQLGTVTESRDKSNQLMAYITDVLCGFDEGGDVARESPHLSGAATTFMTVPGEIAGPQLLPEQVGNDRLVTSTWELQVDRPHGLPEARAEIGIDW